MTTVPPGDQDAFTYPTSRARPFDPPPALSDALSHAPLVRMRYPDGHLGWVATSHALARTILADPRFSARSDFKRTPVRRPGADPFYGAPALPGWLVDMDPPEHTRLRQKLAGRFTARRIRAMRPLVEEAVTELLDVMARQGPPVDLVGAFALPLPSLVICELLGVPYGERAAFQRNSEILFSLDATAEQGSAAMSALSGLLHDVIGAGGGGLPDGLLRELAVDGTLETEEIVGVGVLLLTAGHESTSSSLALSALTLMGEPAQRSRLLADESVVANAVEELLRYLTVFHLGVPRTPLVDVEIDGQVLLAGESVTVCLPTANRDPARFPEDPQRLELGRRTTGHVAFGYGPHQCLGQNLVRMEMSVALPMLFRRFPGMSPAVPLVEIPFSTDMSVYGVHRLPVSW